MSEELPEGWIAHDGGPMPVAPHIPCRVILKTHSGAVEHSYMLSAKEWHWEIPTNLTGSIQAYKPEHPHEG